MFVVYNTGEQVKAKFDGAIFNTFAQSKDYIIKDIGEEFECLYESGSLDIQVGTGQAIIGGRGIVAEEGNTLSLQANSTIYLCLRIDLTQIQGQVGMLYANTSNEIEQGNLNDDSSAKRDLLLAIITTDSNGITNVEDKRIIQDSAGGTITEETPFNISGLEYKMTKKDDVVVGNRFNVELNSGNVLTESVLNAVDEHNVIAQYNTTGLNYTYTAIQDCYVSFSGGRSCAITINGIDICANGMIVPIQTVTKLISDFECFRLKKGDVFVATSSASTRISLCVFGVKR